MNVNSVLNSNSKVAVASHRVLNTRGKVGRLGVRLTVCTNTPKPSFWEQRLSESRPPVIIEPRLRLTGLPFFIQHRTQLDHPDSRQSCLLQNQNQTWNLFFKTCQDFVRGRFSWKHWLPRRRWVRTQCPRSLSWRRVSSGTWSTQLSRMEIVIRLKS